MTERLRSDRLFAANRSFLREADALAPDLAYGESIDGLINPREGLLLYVLARRTAKLGNAVEIGAYKGRSTWCLARALEDAHSPYNVISIDPHEDPEARASYFEMIEQSGLRERIDPRVGRSHDISATYAGDLIGMLWIDGDHGYESVKQDFDDWFPRLEVGGWLAIHDTVNNWHGPTKLTRELLSDRSDLSDIGVVLLTFFANKAPARLRNRVRGAKARASFELLTLMQARHAGFGPQTGS